MREGGPVKELDELLEIEAPMERRLAFAALLSAAVEGEPAPVVVGGHAVEVYSLGTYATQDIDLIVARKEPFEAQLADWGFRRTGRSWWRADLEIAVDLIAVDIDRRQGQITSLSVRGLKVGVLRVEEIIVDRLAACVHGRIADDCEWARQMLAVNMEDIDMDYLARRADEEGVTEALQSIRTGVPSDGQGD